jgi:hypothetical protein
MTEKESFEHGEVVSGLLDLQRRLRGGDPAGDVPAKAPVARTQVRTVEERRAAEPPAQTERPAETVAVSEPDVSVRMSPAAEPSGPTRSEHFAPVTQLPTTAAGDDRMTALAQRLSRLERDLSGVLGSIETIKGDVAVSLATDVEARMVAVQQEVEARAARALAERMDVISTRVSGELGAQRRDIAEILEERIRNMETALRDTIREAAETGVDPDDRQG